MDVSAGAALQVGVALSSATVDTFEGTVFREEHLELLPSEGRLLAGVTEDEL